MTRVFIETYGCSSNQSDSEILAGLLRQEGFAIVDSQDNSDLNIINSCIVKTPTENKMIYRIRELSKTKKPLIVAGCMAKTRKNILEKINLNASLLGPDSIQKIVDVADATLNGEKVIFLKDLREPKLCLPKISKNPVRHITQISTGCSANCSYCAVKLAKGNLMSYPERLIVKDIGQAVKEGYKEIYLTSQDCGCYGKDVESSLPELLGKIGKINGKFFVRVGMMNPLHVRGILDDLIDAYDNEKIFKFLHLPLQSASNRILKLMNRGYTFKDFVKIVRKFRKKFQTLTLSTDIIVGFPSEKESDFKKTVDSIKKIKPDMVNISKFGARLGTSASEMEQLDPNTVSERSVLLHKLVREISLENNKKWIGWKGEILMDENVKNAVEGRNFAYKPIILKEKISLGSFIKANIVDYDSNFLIGKL